MASPEQPQVTNGTPVPSAVNRPAIEITIRFDPDQRAVQSALGEGTSIEIGIPADTDVVTEVATVVDTARQANPPAADSDPYPPQEDHLDPLAALGIALSLAVAVRVLVDWQAAVTVLVIVLELLVAVRDAK